MAGDLAPPVVELAARSTASPSHWSLAGSSLKDYRGHRIAFGQRSMPAAEIAASSRDQRWGNNKGQMRDSEQVLGVHPLEVGCMLALYILLPTPEVAAAVDTVDFAVDNRNPGERGLGL